MLGINGVDEEAGTVFFTANKDDPRQEHVFSEAGWVGDSRSTAEGGNSRREFCEDGKHYYAQYFGPQASPNMSVCAVAGRATRSGRRSEAIADYGLIEPKDLEFKAEDGTLLYGLVAASRRRRASGKIPLIVYIYGGPAGQMVTKGVPSAFHEMLASKGFAIFRWTIVERRDGNANFGGGPARVWRRRVEGPVDGARSAFCAVSAAG